MKKMMLCAAAAALSVVCLGEAAPATAPAAAPAKQAVAKAVDPGKVAAEVNGKKLTYGELDGDIAKLLDKQKVPAERQEAVKKRFRDQLVQQFAIKTILLCEAEKKGVKLTGDELKKREEEFLKSVAGRPGAPKTIDEMLEKYPLGKERAQRDVEENFVIRKLLEQEVTSKVKIDEKTLDEKFAAATSNYTAAVKAAAGAEAACQGEFRLPVEGEGWRSWRFQARTDGAGVRQGCVRERAAEGVRSGQDAVRLASCDGDEEVPCSGGEGRQAPRAGEGAGFPHPGFCACTQGTANEGSLREADEARSGAAGDAQVH